MGEHLNLDLAVALRENMRQNRRKLVFTNGHFDLLHVGHVDYLEKARALGDALFVGLNGDTSTQHLKGVGRPIVVAEDRARLLAALHAVTAVIIFEDDTAERLIRELQPDIYVKGGDYKNKPLPERATVEAYGGEIQLIDYLDGYSTTNIIDRIRKLPTTT